MPTNFTIFAAKFYMSLQEELFSKGRQSRISTPNILSDTCKSGAVRLCGVCLLMPASNTRVCRICGCARYPLCRVRVCPNTPRRRVYRARGKTSCNGQVNSWCTRQENAKIGQKYRCLLGYIRVYPVFANLEVLPITSVTLGVPGRRPPKYPVTLV